MPHQDAVDILLLDALLLALLEIRLPIRRSAALAPHLRGGRMRVVEAALDALALEDGAVRERLEDDGVVGDCLAAIGVDDSAVDGNRDSCRQLD